MPCQETDHRRTINWTGRADALYGRRARPALTTSRCGYRSKRVRNSRASSSQPVRGTPPSITLAAKSRSSGSSGVQSGCRVEIRTEPLVALARWCECHWNKLALGRRRSMPLSRRFPVRIKAHPLIGMSVHAPKVLGVSSLVWPPLLTPDGRRRPRRRVEGIAVKRHPRVAGYFCSPGQNSAVVMLRWMGRN